MEDVGAIDMVVDLAVGLLINEGGGCLLALGSSCSHSTVFSTWDYVQDFC